METHALDKIKRRLIRNVARLKATKLSEDEIWKTLKQTQTFDCQTLWERMKALTSKKLVRLFLSEDCTQKVTPVARMTNTDWLMFDLVLVNEPVEVMVMYEDKIPKNMEHLVSLVLKYQIESRPPEDLAKAWVQLTLDYNVCGRHCSPMLLQRRWYLLKEATRKSFYTLWFSHTNALHKATNLPSHLMTHLAARYPGLLTSPFLEWEELVEKKYIVLPEDLNNEFNKKSSKLSDTNEPDLVALEPTIETIDLVDKEKNNEESNESISNDIESKNENNDEFKNNDLNGDTNLETKTIPKETILCDIACKIEANEEFIATDNQLEEESKEINETLPEQIISCDDKENYQSYTCESEVDNDMSINELHNNNPIKESESYKNKNDFETEYITKNRDGVENLDTPHELEIAENNSAVEKISIKEEMKDNLVKCDGLLNVKIIETSHISDPSTNESDMIIDPTIIETNKELFENESISINKMLCDVTDDLIEDNNLLNNIQVNKELHLKLNVKSSETSNEINDFIELSTDNEFNPLSKPEKSNFIDKKYIESIEGSLKNVKTDIIDISEEDDLSDLEFVDEGIEFHEDDFEPNLQECTNSESVKENDTNKSDLKIDNKLIMLPKVYTKRIENINVLKNCNFNETLNVYNIIDNIILESKPRYIQSQNMLTKQVEKSMILFSDNKSHLTMKKDGTFDGNAMNSMEYALKCKDNNIKFSKTIDDLNTNSSSKNINKLFDINHLREVSTIINKTEESKDYLDNNISGIKAKIKFEDDDISKINIIKDNKEGNIDFAGEVNNDIMDVATDMLRFDLDSSFLKKPINCEYNPIMLCKNPDFNTRLKRLPFGFISIPNNYLMIKACKPLTIDLHKTFESKLVDGVLYLKSNIADIGTTNNSTILKATSTTSSVMPSALPAQSLVDHVKVNISDFVPTENNKTDYELKTISNLHANPVETVNNSEINDYSQKNTDDIAACNKICNNGDHEPEIVNISSNNMCNITQNNITNNTQQNNLQKNDLGKRKKTFRNKVDIPWFTRKSVNLQNINDNILIAKDSVNKMLNHLRNVYNNSESIFFPCANKIGPHYAYSTCSETVIVTDEPLNNKDKQEIGTSNESSIQINETESMQCQSLTDQSINNNNRIKNDCKLQEENIQKPAKDVKKKKRTKQFCCWIKRRMSYQVVSDHIPNSRMRLTKHFHPTYDNNDDNCDCCCKKFDEVHMYTVIQDFILNNIGTPVHKMKFHLIKFNKLNTSIKTTSENKPIDNESIKLSDDEDDINKPKVINITSNITYKSSRNANQKTNKLFIETNKRSEIEQSLQSEIKILKTNPNFELPDGVHLILLPNHKVHAVVEPGVPKLSDEVMQNILENTLKIQHEIKNNKDLLISYPEDIQNQSLENTTIIKNLENGKPLTENSINDTFKCIELSDDENTNNSQNIFTTNKVKFGPIIGCEKGKICINAKSFSPILNNVKKKEHIFVIRPHKSKNKAIYLGNNKILLTSTNLNLQKLTEQGEYNQLPKKNTQSNKETPNFDLPNGVNLTILPNGKVEAVIDSGLTFSPDILNKIKGYAAVIQQEIKNNLGQLMIPGDLKNQGLQNNVQHVLNNSNQLINPDEFQNQTLENIVNRIDKRENEILNRDHIQINARLKKNTEESINELNTLDLNTNYVKNNQVSNCNKNTEDILVIDSDEPQNNFLPLDTCNESTASTQCYTKLTDSQNKDNLEAQINSSELMDKNMEINDDHKQDNLSTNIKLNTLDFNTNYIKNNQVSNCNKNTEDILVIDSDKPQNNFLPLDTCNESTASTQCYTKLTDSQNKDNLEAQINSSELMDKNMEINDDYKQDNLSTNIGTNEKKSILSDLMEMSGISTDDTISENITDNIQLNTVDTNNEIQMNLNTEKTKDILELSPVTSIGELKFATRNNGKFYSLNLDTGQVFSLKIDIRKNSNDDSIYKTTKNNPSNENNIKDIIEIDDSDDDCLVNDAKQPGTKVLYIPFSTKEKNINKDLKRKFKYVNILRKNINNVNKSKSLIKSTIQSQKDSPVIIKDQKDSQENSSQIESLRSMTFDDDSDDEPLIKVKRKVNTLKDKETNPDQIKKTVQNYNQICDPDQIHETEEYLDEESDLDQEENIQNMNIVSNPKQMEENILLNETSSDQVEESIEYLSNEIFETSEESDEDNISQDEPMEWENNENCEDSEAILGL